MTEIWTDPVLLGKLREKGMTATTHHSTIKKVVREVCGRTPEKEEIRLLRDALSPKERVGTGPQFVARRRLTIMGHKYMPGDVVPLDGLRNKTMAMLRSQRLVIPAGERV